MAVFSAVYEGRPMPEAEDAAAVGGAFITCWVSATSKAEAAERARRTIEGRYWVVVAIDVAWSEVTESSLESGSLQHFEQARIDGECYVFHTWGNAAEEDAAAH